MKLRTFSYVFDVTSIQRLLAEMPIPSPWYS